MNCRIFGRVVRHGEEQLLGGQVAYGRIGATASEFGRGISGSALGTRAVNSLRKS